MPTGPNELSSPPPEESARLLDHLKVWPQYLLPQLYLSTLMHWFMRVQARPWKDWQIRLFARYYQVNMGEAAEPDLLAYRDFNSFFTRALQDGARQTPAETSTLVSPADGKLVAFGGIDDRRLFQAKGHYFDLQALLGGSAEWTEALRDGEFATIYLSPRDYHRVHQPYSGRLTQMIYVPGRLFSVNGSTARLVKGLFARNERVVTCFQTDIGPMAVILVGAIFVGSIETVWAGQISPPHGAERRVWDYASDEQLFLERGAELGRFNMGSTVILLFPRGSIRWEDRLAMGQTVRVGQALGRTTHP